VQAINHLSVICCELAVRPLGADILTDATGRGRVVVPGNTFRDYLFFITGVLGRYGSGDQTVVTAVLRLLRSCAEVLPPGSDRFKPLRAAATVVLDDAERGLDRPTDREAVRRAAESLLAKIDAKAVTTA
jgi:uncharacterized membrane protein